jgi:hypothetical protein
MTDRERPDREPAPAAGAAPESTGGHEPEEDAAGSERRRFDLVNVTDDPTAADLRTVVVAFRCTACRQMLHIEYLVSPSPGGAAPADGVACPECSQRHPLRLPGVVRDVWRAD